MMKLYSYHRSSAAYRVRIALNLKQVAHTLVPVNLLKNEHKQANYRERQPQGLVPCLETLSGEPLAQSGAIIDYLEGLDLAPNLKPSNKQTAIKARTIVDMIACDIHPICNLRVLKYLTDALGIDEQQKLTWYRHWIIEGFSDLETLIQGPNFCLGNRVSFADVYLIPQVYNAQRFDVAMEPFSNIMKVYEHCNTLPAFIQAKPENQPDA